MTNKQDWTATIDLLVTEGFECYTRDDTIGHILIIFDPKWNHFDEKYNCKTNKRMIQIIRKCLKFEVMDGHQIPVYYRKLDDALNHARAYFNLPEGIEHLNDWYRPRVEKLKARHP